VRALLLVLPLLTALAACAPRLTVHPPVLAGSFAGTTADGQPVALTFAEDSLAFRGQGTIDGRPVAVAGAEAWCGAGSLVDADGGTEAVDVSLSADGETVTLRRDGGEPLLLPRSAVPPPVASSGPFAGRFRAVRGRAPLAEVTLVQAGDLLAGVGIVTGDAAGIAGRATGARTAEGVVTLADGTQTHFTAELAADGRSLNLTGFGDPLTMTREGAR
jgi:hypothetical protein